MLKAIQGFNSAFIWVYDMNQADKTLLKRVLSDRQEALGCIEEGYDEAMIEYDAIDALIRKLKLYQ
jgi:hypothetical protein